MPLLTSADEILENVLIEMFGEAINGVLDEEVVEDDRIEEIVVVIVSAAGVTDGVTDGVTEILVRFEAVAGCSACVPGSGLLPLSACLLGSLAGALGESDDISLLAAPCCALSSALLDGLRSDIVPSLHLLMKNYFPR